MKTFTSASKAQPANVIVGKHTVDVNSNIHQIQVPIQGIHHKKTYAANELEVVYEYTTTRYSLQEYLAKQAQDIGTLTDAVAELADTALGGN